MTSEDVLASFNHHMGEDSTSAAKGLLTAVKSIKADGKNKVVFELDSPNADFPFIVSDYHISIPASRRHGVWYRNRWVYRSIVLSQA